MATPAQVQTQLGDGLNAPRILMAEETRGLKANYYVQGNVAYPGRVKWCSCTAADSAATQATAILAALLAGPA